MAGSFVVLPPYSRLNHPEDDPVEDPFDHDKEKAKRWTYCLCVGSVLFVYTLFFFGAIIFLQLRSDLPKFVLGNGTLINYSRDADGIHSAMEVELLARNPTKTIFRISSKGSLELKDKEYGTIAPVQVQALTLGKEAKNVPVRCYFNYTRWPDEFQRNFQKFTPPVILPLVLEGDIVVHYYASKILSNVRRDIPVHFELDVRL